MPMHCPHCGLNTRDPSQPFTLEAVLVAKPPGTLSVAGNQMKTVAQSKVRVTCRCGWSILGSVEDGDFVGEPDTQTFPDSLT